LDYLPNVQKNEKENLNTSIAMANAEIAGAQMRRGKEVSGSFENKN